MRLRLAVTLPFLTAAALAAGCSAGHNLAGQGSRTSTITQPSSASAPAASSKASSASKATSLTDGPMTPQQVVKAVTPSVVRIQVSGSGSGANPFSRGSQQTQQGSGTGVVLDDQGHILTNNHVV